MTIEEVREWAANAVITDGRDASFYLGVLDATRGEFDEERCPPAGFVDETPYCEGGREGMLRLAQPEPARRMLHGEITTVGG